ncbi:MAG: acyl-CoA dehydrogenase family protein, partial [Pseudomonadota bacterium]|nr:acyl-CoA dehydrogenase family protein [Pseudomonadota bacterium]
MDFALTDEQRMLEETLTRLVADQVTPEQRRAMLEAPAQGASPLWRTFAELGLLHMPFSEDVGGLGGDGTDVMIIMQALGRCLVPEAYLFGLVMPGQLLALCANPAQQERWLAPLLEGEHQLALAWQEHTARYDAFDILTQASQHDGQWQLNGRKDVVMNLGNAAATLVTAQLPNGKLGVFIVTANTQGVTSHTYRTMDNQPAGDLTLNSVTLPLENCLSEDAGDALAEVLALGRA